MLRLWTVMTVLIGVTWAEESRVVRVTNVCYPRLALVGGTEGKLGVNVTISSEGGATTVGLARGGQEISYDDCIERSVKQWRFAPCSGDAKDCTLRLEMYFSLSKALCKENSCATETFFRAPNRVFVITKKLPAIID